MSVRRGNLHIAELEVLGPKLVLVISWNEINERMHEPVVCLLTATERDRSLPTYVPVNPPEGGVWKPSFILCHSILTLEEWRLSDEPLGSVSAATLAKVDECLARALDLGGGVRNQD